MPGLCQHCHIRLISGRKRKYCAEHSLLASILWKRRHRRLWKAAGDKYWLSDWKNKTEGERRAYFRTYMREYRRGTRRRRPDLRALEERSSSKSVQVQQGRRISAAKSALALSYRTV